MGRLLNRQKQESRTANSTYPKGGVSCSKDRFLVTRTFVLLMNICSESPALRVAANRYAQCYENRSKFNNNYTGEF